MGDEPSKTLGWVRPGMAEDPDPAPSEGHPVVLLVLNAALSAAFSAMVFGGLATVGVAAFTWRNVAAGTLGLMLVTFVVTR